MLGRSELLNKPGLSQWGGGTSVSPVFGQIVNPISTRGPDYAHRSTTSPPPGFSDLATALTNSSYQNRLKGCEICKIYASFKTWQTLILHKVLLKDSFPAKTYKLIFSLFFTCTPVALI